MLSFISAIILLLVSPGPGVLSVAGVGAAFGFRSGLRYFIGLFFGTNIVAIAVITGLAALALSIPWVKIILLCASTLYLLFLAYQIATAGRQISFIYRQSVPGVTAGVLVQIVNPKAYVFNTLLFTGFTFSHYTSAQEIIAKFIIINAIWIPIHLTWLYLGSRIHTLELTASTHERINQCMALALVAVVLLSFYSLNR